MSNQQDSEESCEPAEFKFRSRPLTAGGGIENGIRFFTTAMSALDRIEGLLSQIEQTKELVHQMIGEFSLIGGGVRVPRMTTDEGHACRKKLLPEAKELSERDRSIARIEKVQKRSKPRRRNKTLLEISEEWEKKNPRGFDNK